MFGKRLLPVLVCAAFLPLSSYGAATVVIQNGDAAGVGFNDATPATPVGGNSGTTLGQQRLTAFQAAADKWGETLTSSVTITVRATWEPLSCTSNAATLGSAGTVQIYRNFVAAPLANTWYPKALANAFYSGDLDPSTADIRARFNVNLGRPGCLDGRPFYLGVDNNHGDLVDLVSVLIHELGHGLGFQSFTNETTGAYLAGYPGIWDYFLFDNTFNLPWVRLTPAQRVQSAVSVNHLVWNGSQVRDDAPQVLQRGMPQLTVTAPSDASGDYMVGLASFGPALATPGVAGEIARVIDTEPSLGLACEPLSDVNAAAVTGKIALVDRGTCNFTAKAKNVQDAGAVAVLIANNVPGGAPGLAGIDPAVTIPAVGLSQNDSIALKLALRRGSRRRTGVQATLGVDPSALAGADREGRPLMYAPNPYQPGSSVSHWDTSLTPNQVMEPAINGDLKHEVIPPFDLTYSLLRDIGWQ